MTINPPDAAVAARSFPRRWRAVFARATGDDDAPDLLQRSGAAELADQAAEQLAQAAALLPRTIAHVSEARGASADPLVDLEQRSIELAETIEAVPADDWTADGVAALDVVQRVADLLRRAEAAIEEARRSR